MRARPLCAALLGMALCRLAPAQESHLEQLTHCFDGTALNAMVDQHGTALGATRTVRTERASEALAVSDGYDLRFHTAASRKAVARLLLEQVPADKMAENKQTMRRILHETAQYSEHVQLSARKANGLEVLAMDRSQVEADHIISIHVVFDDASGVMATLTTYGLEDHKSAFRNDQEWYAYRTALLSRLGACMLQQTGNPVANAATAPRATTPRATTP